MDGFIMENLIKMDDLGQKPLVFGKTQIAGNLRISCVAASHATLTAISSTEVTWAGLLGSFNCNRSRKFRGKNARELRSVMKNLEQKVRWVFYWSECAWSMKALGGWFVWNIFFFTPICGGRWSNLTSIFFKGVETNHQLEPQKPHEIFSFFFESLQGTFEGSFPLHSPMRHVDILGGCTKHAPVDHRLS